MKILILCTGNSCRSQIAHDFLQSFDGCLYLRSARTKPAEQVNPKAVAVMKEAGVGLSSHTSVNVVECIDEYRDYVITVCSDAEAICPVFKGRVGKRLHVGCDDSSRLLGDANFIMMKSRQFRDEIKNAVARFYLTEIKKAELPCCVCE